jgi:hypothetical protein
MVVAVLVGGRKRWAFARGGVSDSEQSVRGSTWVGDCAPPRAVVDDNGDGVRSGVDDYTRQWLASPWSVCLGGSAEQGRFLVCARASRPGDPGWRIT